MPLAKRYQIVKALTADRANRPLANGVRLRGSHRRLQNVQPQSFDGVIEWARELAVAIADQEPVRMIRWNGFPQLLQCPFGGWILGHVAVKNPAGRMLDYHEDVEHLEHCRDDREKVACNDRLGVVPDESHPPLIGSPPIRPVDGSPRHVLANRTRRYADPELEQELIGDSLLTPSHVFDSHAADQGPKLGRQRRSPGSGLELPEEPKALAMPGDQRRGFDDDERVAPIECLRQPNESRPSPVIRPPWLYVSFPEQRQLLP